MTGERPETNDESATGEDGGATATPADGSGSGADNGVPDAAFRRVHEALGAETSPAERRGRLLRAVREGIGAETVFLSSVDAGRDAWRVVDAVGPRLAVEPGDRAPLSGTFCRHAADGETALPDTRAAVDDPGYWRHAVGSYLGRPVTVDGETVGTLAAVSAGPRGAFTDGERSLLRAATDALAAHPAVAGVDVDRETADPAAGEHPRPVGVPASWFDGGMLSVGADRRVEYADAGAAEILGAEPESLAGRSLSAAVGGDGRQAELAAREAVQGDHPVTFEQHVGDTWLWAGVYPADEGVRVYLREATERESHERVLERVTDGVCSLDRELRFTYVNGRAADLLGLERPVVGRPLADALPGIDGDPADAGGDATDEGRAALARAVVKALETGETVDLEAGVDDRRVHVRVYADDDGVSVYLHDVTDRRERERRLDALLECTRALMRAPDRSAVAAAVADAVEETLGFDRATVYLHRGDPERLVPASALDGDPDAPSVGPVYAPGEGLVGEAYVTGEARVCEDDGESVGARMAVPLGEHGVVEGESASEVTETAASLSALLAETAVAALDRAHRSERLSLYERVLDSSRDMLYAVDDAGRLTFVSAALAERLDRDRETLVGEHLSAVLVRDGVEEVATIARELARGSGVAATCETRAVTADGTRVPVEVEVSLLGDGGEGAVGVLREIADLEAVREELSRERTRFSRLFENLPDPALEMEVREGRLDGEGASTVRTVNPAFEAAFEVAADGVVGGPVAAAFAAGAADCDGEPVERIERAVKNRRTVSFELRQPTSDGVRDFVFQAIPYREAEDCVRAFGIYTDITEQRDRERRLEVLNRVLRHNMRTQLNVVDGYADYLGDQLGGIAEGTAPAAGDDTVTVDVAPEAARAADEVREAARRVIDLADEARRTLEMVDGDPDDGPVDVVTVAADALAAHTDETADSLTLELPDGDWQPGRKPVDHAPIEADAGSDLRLALDHLVENALVHTGEGTSVAVSVQERDDAVELRVSDDGPGIPAHERAVIAGDTEPTQLEHGSGLGLWVVRWVVEGHGGTVAFEAPATTAEDGEHEADEGGSEDGATDRDPEGTTVVVRLPSV